MEGGVETEGGGGGEEGGLDMWEEIKELEKLGLGFGEGRGGQEEEDEERVVVMRGDGGV